MPQKRSPNKARRGKAKTARPIFNLDLGLELELDFDPDDFDLTDDKGRPNQPKGQPQRDVRILRPRMDADGLTQTVVYENAEAFARQIDLSTGARTYAWINGSFIFGDIVEALITARRVGVKRLYISSLSFSQDNIDSLKNVMLLMGDALEGITLVLSGWMYSKYKYNLIPYLYQELDDPANRVQVAFGRGHAKIIDIETVTGHTITIHGSANLSSNNSIEQIMVEIDNRELHEFNAAMMDRIAQCFGTINAGAAYSKLKPIPGQEAWQTVTEEASKWHQDQPAEPEAAEAAPAAAEPDVAIPRHSPVESPNPTER